MIEQVEEIEHVHKSEIPAWRPDPAFEDLGLAGESLRKPFVDGVETAFPTVFFEMDEGYNPKFSLDDSNVDPLYFDSISLDVIDVDE